MMRPLVQRFAASYIKSMPESSYTDTTNQLFLEYFFGSDEVKGLMLKYLAGLRPGQLKQKSPLVKMFGSDTAAKKIVAKYLNNLSQKELYTSDNLILLGRFTKSIDEPGFKVFYNEKSGKKAEAIIRKKEGYENVRAKDFANKNLSHRKFNYKLFRI